jgi:hypothetical protein
MGMVSLASQRGEAIRRVSFFVGAVIVLSQSGTNMKKRKIVGF